MNGYEFGDAVTDIESIADHFFVEKVITLKQFRDRVQYSLACIALDVLHDRSLQSEACRIVEEFERSENER